jgi:membrane protease YdiL (CAAX protease family)
VGFAISYFVENGTSIFYRSFNTKIGYFQEVVIGIAVGLFFGGLAWQLITSPFLSSVLKKYGGVIQSLKLKIPTIIFLSICAGVGEEIFFRGVIQDYFGVIITAIVFVAIHGYLNFADRKIFIYGIYMTIAIIAIGFMDKYFGLTSAMTAHTVIDIVLFYFLTNSDKVNSASLKSV